MLNLAAKPFEVARSMSVPFFTWRIVLFFLSIFYYGVYIYKFLLISCFFLNVQVADHFFWFIQANPCQTVTFWILGNPC